MIYETVIESLISLRNQWSDLFDALSALNAKLPAAHAAKIVLNNNTAPADPARGLIQCCQDEIDDIKAQLEDPATTPKPAIPQLLAEALTAFRDSDGALRVPDTTPGRNSLINRFELVFPTPADDLPEGTLCRERISQLRRFMARTIQELEEIVTEEGGRFHVKGIRTSVDNLTSYPLLTSQLGGFGSAQPSAPVASAPLGATNGGLQRMVDTAMREVLGRLP